MSRAVGDMKDDSIPLEVREKTLNDANAECIAAYNAVRYLRETCPRCVDEEKLKPLEKV